MTAELRENDDNTDFLSRRVCVVNDLGLHARPAAKLAQEAQRFACDIQILSGKNVVDAKSILDVLTLAAASGSDLVLRARGDDAGAALERLAELFRTKFGEER